MTLIYKRVILLNVADALQQKAHSGGEIKTKKHLTATC
ncbi:hypothetical protein B425_0764 [Bacillus amyloliquefaciens]|nr:hypothetical protein BAMTA208_04035 [Bacillus amyloliquefaciens TA208]KYC96087.1 hypothetical protein B425_0764 [Bacillus amyloliquefaciens]